MQNNTQKRPDSELQLWAVTTPKQSQISKHHKKTNRRPVQRKTPVNAQQMGDARAGRPVQSIKRRRAKRRRVLIYRCLALIIFALFLVGIFQLTGIIYRGIRAWREGDEISTLQQDMPRSENPIEKPKMTVDLLEENRYSRPGTELKSVKNVFVHYTANQGTTAAQNRSYFANLAETRERSASAHFIIGYEGEIIQCIPLDEEAFAVKGRNNDSVSIECCYLSEDGAFTPATYNSLIDLLAWLCGEYGLSAQDILRHYDEGGKKCPIYYVEHEDEWEQLLEDVALAIEQSEYGKIDVSSVG